MPWDAQAFDGLKSNDIGLVAYIPDSAIAPLIERVEDEASIETVPVAREEEAVGVLSGAWLGGTRGALICQTSGLANSFNALGSHAKPVGLPFLGLASRRDLGDHNKAHTAAEYPMPLLLDGIGIRNHSLKAEGQIERKIGMAAHTAFSQEEPYVLFLEPELTEGRA
jgi:sulfopyruvate decarboxylase TPP-binding subunit